MDYSMLCRVIQGEVMMGIFEKFKKFTHKEPGIKDFCIQTIRFRKLLENARGLLALLADGNEKALGEYILDRHYVTSLVDSSVERLGMMIYDACVLVPEFGETLYTQYDRHKRRAGELISQNGIRDKKNMADDTNISSDPEYELLSDVLTWLNGESYEPGATVIDFMRQTFVRVLKHLDAGNNSKVELLLANNISKAPGSNMFLLDLWEDAVAPSAKPHSLDDVKCIPLKLLLMDTDGGSLSPLVDDKTKTATWIATSSEYQLSLKMLEPNCSFHLEATVSGHERSDFIFIFADASINTENILPRGFLTETTDYGQLAWKLDATSKAIEDSLISIGRNLSKKTV
ncbi:MAG: hypothetical protein ACKVE4_12155 [Dissulfuribacterales bacterium]